MIVLVGTLDHKDRNLTQINLRKKEDLLTHITGMSKTQASGTAGFVPLIKLPCLSILSLSSSSSSSPTLCLSLSSFISLPLC